MASYDDDENFGSYGVVGSFPKDFGYGPDEQDTEDRSPSAESKPRILLMGLRRSGKSSIQKVVFHKMSPNETLFLESTNKIVKDDISNSSFVQFQIWDFPGQIDFFDPTFDSEMIFGGCGALIFVIDAQDDYMEALAKLHMTVSRAYKVNPNIKFEVFIHKVDGLSDDHKIETQRDIHQRANDDLADAGLEAIHLSFYLTSIYDHSIFEAFSKVVQKLIPQLPTLENLLNILISNSGIEKAFLFDVVSKIYIATDSSPVDMQSYELCCDMIDVVIDVSCIYGLKDGEGSCYDKESSSIIKLNNATILYLREVNRCSRGQLQDRKSGHVPGRLTLLTVCHPCFLIRNITLSLHMEHHWYPWLPILHMEHHWYPWLPILHREHHWYPWLPILYNGI
ncbi:PREDICTED: ras-related GTP-binding protein C-like isoform X5 [Branchiostoma belcheri]|uniref:Ras-related GTP-binding protein C-like isoform X4 n=1 Tax=Branchiostoma belcheri TaxID=7741 RepID=A0A6P4YNN2_BRABE|nr:PREDICTED: ras-related GTP-binding protein C-like isoform X4 [Branchiostoma belcheri]XP_019618791.1 PREDICTED: ras-related GTP-binding protein C-like isoform X5 [Branchiostoma belcheri]